MKGHVVDAAERQAAIDPSRSCIVQAPAGSGKTELLTRRFLALLAAARRPEEILAITFTRKAAAEMRRRLLEALRSAAGPCPEGAHEEEAWRLASAALARDHALGWHLLENPSLLAIQTIDSFNAALVRRMPWITRLGGMPRIAEQPARLYRRAAERTLARLEAGGEAAEEIACLLGHLDNRLDHLRDLLVAMLARRDQWLRHLVGQRGEEQRHLLERALRSLVEAELARLHASLPPHIRADLEALVPFAAANLLAEGKDGPLARLAAMRVFPAPKAEELPVWKGIAELLLNKEGDLRRSVDKRCGFPAEKTEPCAGMKRRMLELLEWLSADTGATAALSRIRELPPAVYEEEQWQVLRALLATLPLAVAELWLVFREEGTADFAEIALKALQALREDDQPSDLLLRLDSRISHILVDEFQDTSHLQTALLELLTAGWTPDDGRTLFLVGDPMQSIYRFREAEVGLFLQARRRGLGGVPLQALRLQVNFRSQAGIVDWVNRAFALLFPTVEDTARGAVPLAPAVAIHPPLKGPAVTVHPFGARNDAAEAQRVAQLAREALVDSEGGKVAILVRSRTHLTHLLPALRSAGLRYQAQDIDLLSERPAALDLAALTRALLHLDDRLGWLAVLRAPWCGLLLSDLHALCGGRSEPIPVLLADPAQLSRLSPDGQQRAGRAWVSLSKAIGRRGRVGLRQLVEGCWLALGGPVLLDGAALADVERVFDLLETLDYGGDLRDFSELMSGLERLFAASDNEADGRLQVMTMHKAKGLEFDTVILPGLGRRPASGDQPLLRWLDNPEFGLLLGPIHPRDGVSRDPIYDSIGRVEREKEELEAVRLLYVAATRAKKRLHLLGHAPPDRNGDCRPESGSLLKKLWPAISDLFAGHASTPADNDADVPQLSLRRLPAAWQPPVLAAAPLRKPGIETVRPSALKKIGEDLVFSGWESPAARHVGTVTHLFLERIAREGLDYWTISAIDGIERVVRISLGNAGVPETDLDSATQKVLRALRQTVTGERGMWILAGRPLAACEFGISGVIDGELVHAVIDRTFVDVDGTRWIIDYKTSESAENGIDGFLAREAERYRPQLATYVELFRRLEPGRPVRAALYFPLVDAWHEIELGSSDNQIILTPVA